jgi:hypothetical protein
MSPSSGERAKDCGGELARISDIESVTSQQLRQLAAECRVPCLESRREIATLRRYCLQRRPEPVGNQWWAEKIVGARLNCACDLVLRVKWEGWAESANTWQTARDLSGSDVLFQDFFAQLFDGHHVTHYSDQDFRRLAALLTDSTSEAKADRAVLSRLTRDVTEEASLPAPQTHKQWKGMRAALGKWEAAFRRHKRHRLWPRKVLIRLFARELRVDDRFGSVRALLEFASARRVTLEKCREWETEVNACLPSGDVLSVENVVDLVSPPKISYLLSHRVHPSVQLGDSCFGRGVHCDCADDCRKNRSCVCALALYRGVKRFKTSNVVYECTERCLCGKECPNRRIQTKRIGAHLAVVRTRDRGWGLVTRARIPYAAFIMEYVGEVIASEQTERRSEEYFFQLDEEFCGQTLFIDGARDGNVARFANHSCEPNMDIHLAVVRDGQRVPSVAFFAKRAIAAGEELTWDYKRQTLSADATTGKFVSDTSSETDSGYAGSDESAITCLCASAKCKGSL